MSRSRNNHSMNFGKLIEYNVRNILHAENDAGKQDLDFWLFCKKARLGNSIKTVYMIFQTADPEIRSILIFCKGSGCGTSFFTSFWVLF